MKKTILHIYKVMFLLFVLMFVVSCSSSNDTNYTVEPSETGAASPDFGFDGEMEEAAQSWDIDKDEAVGVEDTDGGSDSASGQNNVIYNSDDKIIRKINLSLETKAFDELISSIETQVNELGGYIETSRLTGRHYNSDNLRYGTIIARIPKENVDGFVNNLGNISNIIEKMENVDNVTLNYVDLESRTEALEIEQERLLALLERAEDIEVIISLESRLTSVRYELQSLKTEIRTIDNLVDFSTISMDIQEVELMSVGIDSSESIVDRIERGTQETFRNIKRGFADFIVWLVVNLAYIIMWIIIILLIVLTIKRILNKRKLKHDLKHMGYDKVNEDISEEQDISQEQDNNEQ